MKGAESKFHPMSKNFLSPSILYFSVFKDYIHRFLNDYFIFSLLVEVLQCLEFPLQPFFHFRQSRLLLVRHRTLKVVAHLLVHESLPIVGQHFLFQPKVFSDPVKPFQLQELRFHIGDLPFFLELLDDLFSRPLLDIDLLQGFLGIHLLQDCFKLVLVRYEILIDIPGKDEDRNVVIVPLVPCELVHIAHQSVEDLLRIGIGSRLFQERPFKAIELIHRSYDIPGFDDSIGISEEHVSMVEYDFPRLQR